MPIQHSSFKELRKTKRRTLANEAVRSLIRKDVKNARRAISAKASDVLTFMNIARKTLAKAARKGVIHPNTAARLTSRLEKNVAMGAPSTATLPEQSE